MAVVATLSKGARIRYRAGAVVRSRSARGRLLHGTPAEQDLLGLVTAARGGLSGPDLAALTGEPLWAIEDVLHGVSGRTASSRVSTWQPGAGPEVYLMGHEQLQATAMGYQALFAASGVPEAPSARRRSVGSLR